LDSSGPPGCLQYYKETYGTIENFNFPTATTSLTSGITHLARQNYQVCIRRGINFCYICYTPNITPTTAIILQQSFGVSTGPSGAAIAAQSATGTACTTDFVTVMSPLWHCTLCQIYYLIVLIAIKWVVDFLTLGFSPFPLLYPTELLLLQLRNRNNPHNLIV